MMEWWNRTKSIPISNRQFQLIIKGFVFECPCCNRHPKTTGSNSNGKKIKEIEYIPVSAREVSFKNRGITHHLLTTLLAQIRKPLAKTNSYAAIQSSEDIVTVTDIMIRNSTQSDSCFELMVFHKRMDMPDVEAIYYYIRNAFAHGSFEVIKHGADTCYLIESSKEGKIKARMRLNEKTLVRYLELKDMSISEIKSLRTKKK